MTTTCRLYSAGRRPSRNFCRHFYTVIQACKANSVTSKAYIADAIVKIADDWPASRWDELMPWNWVASGD